MTGSREIGTDLSRRGFLTAAGLGALGLGLSGALAGCASSGGNDQLTLWMDIAGTPDQEYFTKHVQDAFGKDVKGTTVKTTYYQGQDLRRLIQSALQAKSGPDVVRGASATQTLAWSQAHLLADLTDYEKQYGWAKDLLPWSVNAFTNNGHLWAMPMRVDTMLLYYNKTLFADKNWTLPTNRDDLESLAAEVQGMGIIPFGASNVDWTAGPEWLMTLFWNHFSGPDALYQALTSKIRFTDPVFVDAVTLIKSYFDKGWFAGGTDKYFSVPSQQIGAEFGAGKVAMFPQGEWYMPALSALFGKAAGNDNEWDWASFPALSDDVKYPLYSLGIGGSLGINAASSKKDKAAEFINWYYTNRQQALQRMADVPATYNIPIPVASGDLPGSIDPRSKRLIVTVNEAVQNGDYGYVTWTWWPAQADVYVYEGLQKVLTGGTSPKDYCAQLDTLFRQGVASGAVPTIIPRSSSQ